MITSLQNARVKEAAKLRNARQRARQGRFLIDGAREIGRALDASVDVCEAFVCPALCGDDAVSVVQRLPERCRSDVTPEVFERLAFGDRSDGIVVVAATTEQTLSRLRLPSDPLVAVLAGIEKPGNVGAIIRTADGAGVDAVIVADGGTDLMNPNTIRASLGTIFSMQLASATAAETLAQLRDWQISIVATRPDADQVYSDFDYRNGAAILLGSESSGLPTAWDADDVISVQMPMCGRADSLNVSATAAVVFYEAWRQRNA